MNPPSTKSWRRFLLSTLFIAVTIIGMFLAIKFHREPLTMENLSQLQKRQRIDVDVFRVVWNATEIELPWWAGRSRLRSAIQ